MARRGHPRVVPAGAPLEGAWNQTRRIWFALPKPATDTLAFDVTGPAPTATGVSTHASGSVPANFGHTFYATVHGGADGGTAVAPVAHGVRTDGGALWGYLDFDPADPGTATLVVRVATSLLGAAQARAAHAAEVCGGAREESCVRPWKLRCSGPGARGG